MTLWIAVPLTLFVVVLQLAGAPSFMIFGVHADLPVAWIGCWAMVRGRNEAMALIPVAGLGLGLLGREPLGASLLALMPIVAYAAMDELRVVHSKFVLTLAVVFLGGLTYSLLFSAAGLLGGDGFGPPLGVLRIAPRAAMLDVLIAALWYWPIRLAFSKRVEGGRFRRT